MPWKGIARWRADDSQTNSPESDQSLHPVGYIHAYVPYIFYYFNDTFVLHCRQFSQCIIVRVPNRMVHYAGYL